MITDVLCSDISDQDIECVRCRRPIKTASTFIKYHANCSSIPSGQLSDTTTLEASQQKRRINKAVKDRLKKRARDDGTDRTSPNKRFKDTGATSALQFPYESNPGNESSISGVHLLIVV